MLLASKTAFRKEADINVEYDNDTDPSSAAVSYRQSAIFQPFQSGPIDHLLIPHSRPHSLQPASRPVNEELVEKDEEGALDLSISQWDLPNHLLSPPQPPLPLRSVDATRVKAVSTPLNERALSVHLDVHDGVGNEGNDVRAGISGSLDPIVEGRGSMQHLRSSSIDQALNNAKRVLRMAEDVGRQERRISNPLMASFPASPLHRPVSIHDRPCSVWSENLTPSGCALDEEEVEGLDTPNPFEIRAPPVELASRFDPKVLQAQRRESFDSSTNRPISQTSLTSPQTQTQEPARPISRLFDDVPTPEQFGRPLIPNRYSSSSSFNRVNRQSLRPKTLVMPTPLSGRESVPSPPRNVPEGFVIGEKPLPPGSRTSILVGGGRGLPRSFSGRTFRSSSFAGREVEDQGEVEGQDGEKEEGGMENERAMGGAGRRPGKLYVRRRGN